MESEMIIRISAICVLLTFLSLKYMELLKNRIVRNSIMLIICFLSLVLMFGCTGVPKQYIRADQATYSAISPEYRNYVRGDPTLSELQKGIRFDAVDMWKARIDAELMQ